MTNIRDVVVIVECGVKVLFQLLMQSKSAVRPSVVLLAECYVSITQNKINIMDSVFEEQEE